jgi:hypothetical protein
MRDDHGPPSFNLSDTIAQIAYEFIKSAELGPGWLVSIEVTDQTNSHGDVVEVVTRYVSAVELSRPARTNFNLAVAGGSAIADDKVIGQSVLHPTHAAMIPIEDASVSLSGSAVVNDDVFPPAFLDSRPINCSAHSGR